MVRRSTKPTLAVLHKTCVASSTVMVVPGVLQRLYACAVARGVQPPTCALAGACAGGAGQTPETFTITTPAANGGEPCQHAHGATRTTSACVNSNPCPIACTSTWQPNGVCSGACGGGSGTLPEVLVVSSPALHGGSCPGANGE